MNSTFSFTSECAPLFVDRVTPPASSDSADCAPNFHGHGAASRSAGRHLQTLAAERAPRHSGEPQGDRVPQWADLRRRIEAARLDVLTDAETRVLKRVVNEAVDLPGEGRALAALLAARMRREFSITAAEVDAIDAYQGNLSGAINRALRQCDRAKLALLREPIVHLYEALEKLPKTGGTRLVRRLSFPDEQSARCYLMRLSKVGAIYTAPQFESARRGGVGSALPDNHPFRVTVTIDATGHHGAEISSVMNARKSEYETLYPPGTRFLVLQPSELPPPGADHGSHEPFHTAAHLQELEARAPMPLIAELRASTLQEFLRRNLGGEAARDKTAIVRRLSD